MKKLVMIAVAASMVTGLTSISRAADDAAPKKDKAARHAELLKKYDKNGDGKLDESEKAAMKEDLKKQKKNAEPKKEDSK
ncbi:MAG TPA: hypothetical protein VKM56_00950 [Verrucomicrobiae bacterium]|nr:hypothetical protein [Verrucomicrobiae bacterium]